MIWATYIPLILIVKEDFSERKIRWFYLPTIFMLFSYLSIDALGIQQSLIHFGGNLLFVIFNLIGLTIYFSLKEKKLVNIADLYIGWGDLLLMIAITPLFAVQNFILFFTSALFISILFGIPGIISNHKNTYKIPMAGVWAACLILLLMSWQFNLISTPFIPYF